MANNKVEIIMVNIMIGALGSAAGAVTDNVACASTTSRLELMVSESLTFNSWLMRSG